MAVKFSVQYDNGSTQTINFYGFDDKATQDRFFIDFQPDGAIFETRRFNMPGVDGNLTTKLGNRGGSAILIVRYQGPAATIAGLWQSDRENFARYTCAITDGTTTYTRATLRPNSGNRITEELADGSTGDIFYHVRYLFDLEDLL